MNQEELFELVLRAQSEDADAMEQLLLWTYTPVSWLCRKLLQDRQAAEEQTQSILKTIFHKLNTLQDPQQYDAWFCRITAARCAQILPQLRWGSTARSTEVQETPMDIAGKDLTEEETVRAIGGMVDTLPEDVRVCILLCCCAGMNSRSIAQAAGYTPDTVKTHLSQGQALLQEKLNEYQQQGTTFSGITTLQDILRTAMYQANEGDDPIPTVYGILGKEIPVPPDPEKQLRRILGIIVAVLVAVNVILCGVLFLTFRASIIPLETVPTEAATLPPTTAATEVTTEPTLAETTETTVPETTAQTTPAPAAETAPQATAAATQPSTAATQPAASQPTAAPSTATTAPQETAAHEQSGADGHTHNFKTYSAVNCETGGTKRHDCTLCDYSYTEELQPTGSHSFTTRPTTQPGHSATCTSAGKAYRICTKCNYGEVISDPSQPALGHDYVSTVVAPTSTEKGYTQHKCSRCGDSYQDTFVDPIAAPTPQESTDAPEV